MRGLGGQPQQLALGEHGLLQLVPQLPLLLREILVTPVTGGGLPTGALALPAALGVARSLATKASSNTSLGRLPVSRNLLALLVSWSL